jgi:hypothetical protein
MLLDFLIALSLVLPTVNRKWYVLSIVFLFGIIGLEYFSSLPALIISLPLIASATVVRLLLDVFDTTSPLSSVLAVTLGILFFAFLTSAMRIIYSGEYSNEYVWRSIILTLRVAITVFFLSVTIISTNYLLAYLRHVFVEEKKSRTIA